MAGIDYRKMSKEFLLLEKKIKEYSRIVVYRHASPDFDALGAQMGLVQWIKDNYPEKEVHYVGDRSENLMPDLFPYPEEGLDDFFSKEHLAIVVDVANQKRIAANQILRAKEVIKIDHHNIPAPEEDFGNIRIIYPDRPAASEIIALFLLSRGTFFKKTSLSVTASSSLFCGIVGDTGRFQYQDCDGATLRIAADLLDMGIDKEDIYRKMYRTDRRKLAILNYCLSHYKITEKGTCYYILDEKTMQELSMTTEEGNLHINVFRDMVGVKAVVSVTYDTIHRNYRVSLRSSSTILYPAVQAFGGGGHDYSAGCHLASLDDLPKLLAAVDKL